MAVDLSFVFRKSQRDRFRSGELVREWRERYPNLFDKDDERVLQTDHQRRYNYYEGIIGTDHSFIFSVTTMRLERVIIGTLEGKRRPTRSRPRRNCLPTSSVILRGGIMKTVTLDVRSPADSMADFAYVWKSGKPQKSARISFASPELLWRVLTQKRWQLLKALCGAGPVSIREAARRVGRDVKAVHSDVTALLSAGIIDRTDDGHIVFPFEAVKVEFLLQVA